MLHREDRGGITILRLDHGKAHALDLDLARTLGETFEALAGEEIRALVLTGTGGIFSAGVDLHRLLEGGPAYARAFVPALTDAFSRLFGFPRPAIAAVNGHAIAGGCVLAAACDYRLMAAGDGTIGVPELRVGVPFPLVAIEILRFATSPAHLQELVYRGTTYAVGDAYDRGLVDEVVPPEQLLERALAVADRLASGPAARFRITKRQLRAPTIAAIRRHAAETDGAVLAAWEDPTTLAAIRAYVESLRARRG